MGLRGEAAIVGYVELPPERLNKAGPAPFTLEQWAELAAGALADAGLPPTVDGIVTSHSQETQMFVPSTVAEYLGIDANFAELVDLGGASAAGWCGAPPLRSSSACATPCSARCPPRHMTPASKQETQSTSSTCRVLRRVEQPVRLAAGRIRDSLRQPGTERTLRTGRARCTAPIYGYDERAMAKIVVDQRVNANHTAGAIFTDKPMTVDDVLASPMIADSAAHAGDRDAVRRRRGGRGRQRRRWPGAAKNRPVWIKGFGERVPYKTPDLRGRPAADADRSKAAETAFAHGRTRTAPTWTWCRSTTATRSPCCSASRTPASARRARACSSSPSTT